MCALGQEHGNEPQSAVETAANLESPSDAFAETRLGTAGPQVADSLPSSPADGFGEVEESIHMTANALALPGIDPVDAAGARLDLARRAPQHPLAKRLAVEALDGYFFKREPDRARLAYEFLLPAPDGGTSRR